MAPAAPRRWREERICAKRCCSLAAVGSRAEHSLRVVFLASFLAPGSVGLILSPSLPLPLSLCRYRLSLSRSISLCLPSLSVSLVTLSVSVSAVFLCLYLSSPPPPCVSLFPLMKHSPCCLNVLHQENGREPRWTFVIEDGQCTDSLALQVTNGGCSDSYDDVYIYKEALLRACFAAFAWCTNGYGNG